MKNLKKKSPRIWCALALLVLAVTWPVAYIVNFCTDIGRIWLNIWDDLRGIFSEPWQRTAYMFGPPWNDVKRTWRGGSSKMPGTSHDEQ